MQYSNSGGMIVAVVAMALLVLLCRWVFSTGDREKRTARRLAKARSGGDYGLLVPVATARTDAEARQLRDVLREAGIRCTVADAAEPGSLAVLVFRADADRARSFVPS